MKRIAIVAIALGMAVLAVPSVMANGDNGPNVAPTTVVLGADNPLIDVPAVQSAVDQGGTVILRGKFDFGPTWRRCAPDLSPGRCRRCGDTFAIPVAERDVI